MSFDAPALGAGEVHVWTARLSALRHTEDAILDPSERARAERFRFERDRLNFMLGRVTLRRILAAYLERAPADVPLIVGPHGKPELACATLHFNVSHSGDLALYAVSRDGPVGIDVEQVRPVPDLDGVADLVMSPRERAAFALCAEAARPDFFHGAWARKEAYLKALGDGLLRSPTLVEFGALLGEEGEPIRDLETPDAAYRWRCSAWQPEPGYWSALVAPRSVQRIAFLTA